MDRLFVTMPRSGFVLECYAHYLYHIGAASLPGAFVLIADKFGDRLGPAINKDTRSSADVSWRAQGGHGADNAMADGHHIYRRGFIVSNAAWNLPSRSAARWNITRCTVISAGVGVCPKSDIVSSMKSCSGRVLGLVLCPGMRSVCTAGGAISIPLCRYRRVRGAGTATRNESPPWWRSKWASSSAERRPDPTTL